MVLSKRFQNDLAAKILVWSFITILTLMPVHTFFTTWLGANVGYEEVIKAWKEILMFFNGFVVLALWRKYPNAIWPILTRPINVLIAIYILLHLILWPMKGVEADAAIAGIMMNGRFLVMFVMAQIAVRLVKRKAFEALILRIFFTGAGVVAVIGTLQALVLDKEVLSHFGYSEDTIKPYLSLDGNDDLIRVNSTLRGPNPLGSYLIFPLLATIHKMKRHITMKAILGLAFMGVAMLFTFSRSAWLGFGISFVVYAFLVMVRYPVRLAYTMAAIIILSLGALSAVTVWRDSYLVQTYVFHDDPNTGGVITSNEEHIKALRNASQDVLENPIGDGPGTAGPASRYNDDVTRIGENYFLQIGQETGVLGLGLFLSINAIVAIQLWWRRHERWPRILLSTMAGLTFVNIFLHGWSDDATAIIWWSFAGIYYDN